jgi:signal peptidase I
VTSKSHHAGEALQWILVICVAVAVSLLVRAFVVEVYQVPSGSMLDTIQLGDRLVGEKVSIKLSEPTAGEVVTFEDPEKAGVTLIKRVIAVGGQTVDIQDGSVYVDGKRLDESYVEGKRTDPLAQHSSTLSGPISYPYAVPAGYLWVMGDNRTNSLDSRYFGAVSSKAVSSHALCIFWPTADAKAL